MTRREPSANKRFAAADAVRRAFTLTEILIVVTIIAVLMTLTLVASMHFLTSARVAATRATIKKIDEQLNRRLTAFERGLDPRTLAGGNQKDSEIFRKYRGYVQNNSLGRKRLTVKFFGMTHGEFPQAGSGSAIGWATADLNGVDLAKLGSDYIAAKDTDPTTNNPEMLYWFLMNGPTFGADAVDKDYFKAGTEVGDTDGDGLPEFLDAWGHPIRFYRWPTRLLRPAPPDKALPAGPGEQPSGNLPYWPLGPVDGSQLATTAPASMLISSLPTYNVAGDNATTAFTSVSTPKLTTPLGEDRDDPFGDALEQFFGEGSFSGANGAADAARAFEIRYHTPNTWHSPLIVSGGPDEELGLFEPNDTTNFGHLAQPKANAGGTDYTDALQDDITNLNTKASSSGGR